MNLHFRPYERRLAHNSMVASCLASGGKSIAPVVLLELRDAGGVVG